MCVPPAHRLSHFVGRSFRIIGSNSSFLYALDRLPRSSSIGLSLRLSRLGLAAAAVVFGFRSTSRFGPATRLAAAAFIVHFRGWNFLDLFLLLGRESSLFIVIVISKHIHDEFVSISKGTSNNALFLLLGRAASASTAQTIVVQQPGCLTRFVFIRAS